MCVFLYMLLSENQKSKQQSEDILADPHNFKELFEDYHRLQVLVKVRIMFGG